MKWSRVGSHGMQSGEYVVGKFVVMGKKCYRLFHGKELLATCDTFDDAKNAAKTHQNALSEAITR